VKNFYIFRTFAASSWFGMSFSKLTTFMLSDHDRIYLVNQGKLSKVSLIKPFSAPKSYAPIVPTPQKTNIPVLDQVVKSTGVANFNNLMYIDISKRYLRDALYVLRAHTKTYLKGIATAFFYYFLPSSDYWMLDRNRKYIHKYDRLYSIIFAGRTMFSNRRPYHDWSHLESDNPIKHYLQKLMNMGLLITFGYPILVIYGFFLIRKKLMQNPKDTAFITTVSFILINILFVSFVGNCFEVMENNRFRFLISPFFLILFSLFLNDIFYQVKDRFWHKTILNTS
jgi:hypothetical protein